MHLGASLKYRATSELHSCAAVSQSYITSIDSSGLVPLHHTHLRPLTMVAYPLSAVSHVLAAQAVRPTRIITASTST
jgi:hypothetical protein